MQTPDQQLCTFEVAGLLLGLDVLGVQEVLRRRTLAHVPLAPAVIEGLLNLRGQIVTAIDLRRRLGLPPRPAGAESMLIIARTQDAQVALIVDRVGDVVEVSAATFEPPPETVPGNLRGLLRGVHKLPGRILHVLEPEQVVSLPAHS